MSGRDHNITPIGTTRVVVTFGEHVGDAVGAAETLAKRVGGTVVRCNVALVVGGERKPARAWIDVSDGRLCEFDDVLNADGRVAEFS